MILRDSQQTAVFVSDDVAPKLRDDIELNRLKRSYLHSYGEHTQARLNGPDGAVLVYDTLSGQGVFLSRVDVLSQLPDSAH